MKLTIPPAHAPPLPERGAGPNGRAALRRFAGTKIAFVTTSDMSIGVLFQNQLRELQALGVEVVAICSPGPYVREVERAGIRAVTVPITRAIAPMSDLRSLVELRRVLRAERPTIVHTHTPKAGLIGQYAALLARVPIRVHTIHGLYFPGHMTPRSRRVFVALEQVTMRFAHRTLSVNPEDVPVAIEEGICREDQIRLLGGGIDLSRFDPAGLDPTRVRALREETGIAADDRVVGIVGRVNREKGYVEFFEAAASIAKADPRAKFLVVGPIEREKFDALDPRELAERYGVANRTIYLGLRSDLPELYSLMDVLVLPSHREGLPVSPQEAAAMGVPVVATNIRGCRQVVEDGVTGLLVPLRDPAALASAVSRLLAEPEEARRLGAAGRRRVEDLFDERDVIDRLFAEYAELLARLQPS